MMKKRIGIILWIFVVLTMLFAVPAHASGIRLNKKSLTVCVGKTARLKVIGTKKKVKWSSSNKKIARVSKSGLVRGVKKGKCKIIAKIGKKKLKCTVTVKKAVSSGAKRKPASSSNSFTKSISIQGLVDAGDIESLRANTQGGICKRTLSDGWYMIVSGNSDDRVLDINEGNAGNLETYYRNNTVNQRFYLQFTKDHWYSSKGYYTLMAQNSGKYLHIENSGDKYANVHQWSGSSHINAKWSLTDAGDGYYYIASQSNGSCLDNSGGRTNPGNNVVSYPFNGTAAQKWKFLPTSRYGQTIQGGGTYEIQSANNSSYVLDIQGAKKNNGANLILYSRNNGANQRFVVEYNNNGYYTIKAKHSGKYLHTADNTKYANVHQWEGWMNYDAAKWIISDAGNGYCYIQNKETGSYLENANGKVRDSNNVRTWVYNGKKDIKWKFVRKDNSSNTSSTGSLTLVIDPASTLSLTDYTQPTSITEGSGFTCKGTVSSNYSISQVTVGIYTSSGTAVSDRTVYPNAKTYSLINLDSYIHFSYLKPGTYYYKVWAKDQKQSKYLLNKSFTVAAKTSSSSIILTLDSTWRMPMDNWKCTWDSSTNYSWGNYSPSDSRPDRPYHSGVDITGTDGKVYAAADGIVRYQGEYGSNGKHVVLEHNLNGTKVYSFYAHLASYQVYTIGSSIKKGAFIGIHGNTGLNAAPGKRIHLHFGVFSGTYGSHPVGYVPYFTGNSVTYKNQTFYNPVYVVNNEKLP